MKHPLSRLSAATPVVGLSLLLATALACAQGAPAATPTPAPAPDVAAQAAAPAAPAAPEELDFEEAPPLQVGDAATSLLAWQRDGGIASPTPRPIAGDVARRSYERYLKSFEYPIPERLNSTVKTGASAGNSSSSSSGTR
jgi:hypothetical protein